LYIQLLKTKTSNCRILKLRVLDRSIYLWLDSFIGWKHYWC